MSKDKRNLAIIVGVALLVVVGLAVYANQRASVANQPTQESGAPTDTIDRPGDAPDEQPAEDPDTPVEQPIGDDTSDDEPNAQQLTREMCEGAGGTWNACGSACRGLGPDEGACIQVCVEMCECQSNNQCPDGFECGEYVNGTGICQSDGLPVSK